MGAALLVGLAQPGARAADMAAQAASPPGRTAAQVTDPRALSAAGMPQRQALLEAAETALERGLVSSAIIGFERAGMMLHAADSEMGLVRAWMQQGEYRRALVFAAHTAGAHRDTPAASALYVWLLNVGGQTQFAEQLLAATSQRAPDDVVVDAVRLALSSAAPSASGVMLDSPHRMAPASVARGEQQSAPAGLRQVANGTLLGEGRRALVPAGALQGARRLWVRNGLGHMSAAQLEPDPPLALQRQGLAVLRLQATLGDGRVRLAPRDPFAGSPGFAAAYPASEQDAPAWPWISQGFFGALDAQGGSRKAGIRAASSQDGGPLFDAAGRLAGVRVHGAHGREHMVPVSLFRDGAIDAPGSVDAAAGNARIGLDEAYEQALQVTLQVLVVP